MNNTCKPSLMCQLSAINSLVLIGGVVLGKRVRVVVVEVVAGCCILKQQMETF